MKKFALLYCVLFAVFSQFAYAEVSVEARVAAADEKFNQVVKTEPQKEVHVIMFFSNDMKLSDVQEKFRVSGFDIKGFRHGTQSYSGGYGISTGETFEQAIVNYERDHLFFLQTRVLAEEKMLTTKMDDQLRKAIVSHQKEAQQMKLDFQTHGLRIIGIELVGRAQALDTFKENNSFIRVVELKDQDAPQSAILPSKGNSGDE